MRRSRRPRARACCGCICGRPRSSASSTRRRARPPRSRRRRTRSWGRCTAYQRSAAVKGALDLDLFTAIGRSDETAATLATWYGASPRGTRILCDYLTVAGFLTKRGDRYALTADSARFLDRGSPAGVAAAADFVPDEGRGTPPHAAMFSLVMLCSTPAGDAYTFAELDAMLRRAGFGGSELRVPGRGGPQVIISQR